MTNAIGSNPFHVLLRVPQHCEVLDRELLRRYGVLCPQPTPYQSAVERHSESRISDNLKPAKKWG